jgi:uncharacterized oxidoreductase
VSAIRLRPAPQVVVHGEGAVATLLEGVVADGSRRPLVLSGRRARAAAASSLSGLPASAIEVAFGGECSPGEVERLRARAERDGVDAVIGVGGGKVLDTAKALGAAAGLPVHLVPTLASTCAAWSPLSVFYDNDHRHLGHTVWEHTTRSVALEPDLLLSGPVEYFVSGIADTLAKWVETRSAFETADRSLLTELGLAQAEVCRDTVLEHAALAVADLRAGRPSASARRVADAGVATAGLVGGFGGASGSATLAHPVSDGLSALPETVGDLHGVKVAYGILVQLAAEERFDELDAYAPVYADLGLPRCLADLGIAPDRVEAREIIAETALSPHSSAHALGPLAHPRALAAALAAVEDWAAPLDRVAVVGR